MKKLFLLSILFFSFSLFSQNSEKITTKKCIPKKGLHFKLKNVFNDSRCPQVVDCIWAGEVSAIVEIYKDKKLVEEKTLTFNSRNSEQNNKCFENYFTKKIKSVSVMPTRKEGEQINPKKYFINIVFSD
jgi:ATP-dependent RNA circularization protein (DNA/RNA ligase family)